ncbi:hypothetical protein [Amycolatopsis alkalitolerans]|uniref:WXG100 family type VII secretion target n=1 Tax=Amycolatopsis alkalitolerans TaxID=2547244 RepID=A0A5C4LRI8_9PSEU|nr:hypothetical protein [Amycolatopsis alkalitolerans]TNC20659.1 hypothetical protein FG385_30285 [Amycolatopsis alkalitolerans]
MTGFEADVDRLSARAKDFDALVERAARISAELEQALDGAPWGDDMVGQSFAAAHTAPAAEAVERVKGLAGGLGGAGGSFADAARRYQAGDTGAADAIRGE